MAFLAGHGIHRDDAAKHPLGFFAKTAENARRHADFVARLLDGFAVLLRQEFAQVIQIVFNGIGNSEQDSGALVSGQLADRMFATLRDFDGLPGVFQRPTRNGIDQLAGGGVTYFNALPVRRLDPLAVNQHLHKRFSYPGPGQPNQNHVAKMVCAFIF